GDVESRFPGLGLAGCGSYIHRTCARAEWDRNSGGKGYGINGNDGVIETVGHKSKAAFGVQRNSGGNGAGRQGNALHKRVRAYVNHLDGRVGGTAGKRQMAQNLDG